MVIPRVVFNGSKILIRKQITTGDKDDMGLLGCFQWFKDTNSKANHNKSLWRTTGAMLFSMVQRY